MIKNNFVWNLASLPNMVLDKFTKYNLSRSQWLGGLRNKTAVVRLLGLWVRIPPKEWIFVCCECCVLSGKSLRRAYDSCRGVLPTVKRRGE
jgi:hypothetical protein